MLQCYQLQIKNQIIKVFIANLVSSKVIYYILLAPIRIQKPDIRQINNNLIGYITSLPIYRPNFHLLNDFEKC